MVWYGGYGFDGYYRQPTKAELQHKAQQSMAALRKQGREIRPVQMSGVKIGRTWWGEAWVSNIARYADFSNRIARGKKYVRANCVIDLQVSRGHISAIVQGSRKKPYEVDVDIEPLSQEAFSALVASCSAKAKSLEALVAGDFPDELKERLTAGEQGLFPSPKQISFDCSCPDWAYVCKHVAAAIMGVAPQLDEDPLLLFELRGVDTSELVARTVAQKIDLMLENADVRSERVMEVSDEELTELFGVL